MKKLSTLIVSLLILFTAHATLYTGTLSTSAGTGGSNVTVTFTLTTGPAISGLVIYSSVLGVVSPVTTTDNPVFGIFGNNYTATFTVPSGLPNGTPVFFTISNSPFSGVYGNSSPFPVYTILPVAYLSSTAKIIDGENKVLLSWRIASADGVKEFNIMRSTDGVSFNKIGTVVADSKTDYMYQDYLPVTTTINYYYKISGLSLNGAVKETGRMLIRKTERTISPVILNNGGVKNALLVSGVNLMNYKAGEIKVYDITGRNYAAAVKSSNTIYLDAFSAGIYFLKVGDNAAMRFIKQ